MKRDLNKIKKLNKKGFTLIEILGVIIIMGLIIIVAIPTMSRMIHNNNNQEYENYNKLINEAAEVYTSKLKDQIGSSKYVGCARIELNTLINEGYLKEFDDKDVTCRTGSNGITIRNNKGSITVNFQLICSRGSKEEYNTGNENNDSNTCTPYQMKEENNIKMKLDSDTSITVETPTGSKETYITGGNNYVYYSGKIWRIVSYNNTTETVKIVTDTPMTSIYYNYTGATTYSGSDVETWLNNDFLLTLKDASTFITSYNWNATANDDINTNKSNTNSYKKNKVGLITTYEYGRIKSWYGNDGSWVMSDGGYITNASGVTSSTVTTFRPIRPAVVITSDVLVHEGSGSASDPYIIDNTENAIGQQGEYINTRFSGEYVQFGGKKYRIISVSEEVTKVMAISPLGEYTYDTDHYNYSASDLRIALESAYSSKLGNLANGDFCLDTINGDHLAYRSTKCLTPMNNAIKVGIPQIGDIFATKVSGDSKGYWTLNPHDELDATGQAYGSTINIIKPNGTIEAATITSSYNAVPVFYLNSNVKITGNGEGTLSSPYPVA